MMESQIATLEQRLKRRDQELTALLEDARSASKFELSRLQAIHQLVIRQMLNNLN